MISFSYHLLHGVSASAILASLPTAVVPTPTYDVTIPAGKVASDLTRFPVWVDLSAMPTSFWNDVTSTGGNIHCYKSGVEIAFDLVTLDKTTRRGSMFVLLDVAAAGSTVFQVKVTGLNFERRLPAHPLGRNAIWSDYEAVTLFGPDASDRTGKIVVRSSGDPDFLKMTSPIHTFSEDPHQGGTWDGTHFYMTDTNRIYKYNALWNLVASNLNPIAATGLPVVNHLGDPTVKDGKLYIPLEYYATGTSSNQHICTFDAATLAFIEAFDISAVNHEVSSICFCPVDGLFYVTDFNVGKVHKYTTEFAYVGEFVINATIPAIQGIEWYDGAFWLVSHNTDEIARVDMQGNTLLQPGSSTEFQGYFGRPVINAAMEGIFKVGDSLYMLHDPNSGNSFISKFEPYNAPLMAGGGYERTTLTTGAVQLDDVPELTTWTIGVSGRLKSKASNGALASYIDHIGGTGINDRATLSYRVSDASYGIWDDVNTWLLPTVDFDPVSTAYHRLHMQYDNTSRKLFANGAVIASQAGITARTGFSSVNFGREDADQLEVYVGEIGFGYLRNSALSADWIAAEYAMLNSNGTFLQITGGVEEPGEPSQDTTISAVAYIGTVTSAEDLKTYTFSNAAIGAADPDRKLIIGVSTKCALTNQGPPLVTVNGKPAKRVMHLTATYRSGDNSYWQIDHPAGETANIVVDCYKTALRAAVSVWRVIADGPIELQSYTTGVDTTEPTLVLPVTTESKVFVIGIIERQVTWSAFAGDNFELTDGNLTLSVDRNINATGMFRRAYVNIGEPTGGLTTELVAVAIRGSKYVEVPPHVPGTPARFMHRYTNIGGMGRREPIVNVTTDAVLYQTSRIGTLADGNFTETYSGSVSFNGNTPGVYIDFDFYDKRKNIIALVMYKTWDVSVPLGTWDFLASNDKVSWVPVITDIFWNSNHKNVSRAEPIEGYYRYFRLQHVSGNLTSQPWMREVEFCILDKDGGDDTPAVAPSYDHVLSKGDRRMYMTIGGTAGWGGNGWTGVVEGTQGNHSWFLAGQTLRTVEFDFMHDVLITEIKWTQSTATTHGTWKWQAQDMDTGLWMDIGGSFTLGGLEQIITSMSAATTYHRKFRLQQVSGVTSSSPYVREIEFKLGTPELQTNQPVAAKASSLNAYTILKLKNPGGNVSTLNAYTIVKAQ